MFKLSHSKLLHIPVSSIREEKYVSFYSGKVRDGVGMIVYILLWVFLPTKRYHLLHVIL